jgi:hypothetical protein
MTYHSYREISGPDGRLANLQAINGNSMHAEVGRMFYETGRMASDHARIACDLRDKWGVRYVVYSYATPIAFVFGNGIAWVPDQGYSVTTTRQQNDCRAWLGRNVEGLMYVHDVHDVKDYDMVMLTDKGERISVVGR